MAPFPVPCPCVVCTAHSVIYKPIIPCPCVVCTANSVIYKPIVPCPCVVCTVHSVIYKPIVPCPCVVCTVDSVIYKPIVPCPCVVCTVHSVIYKPIVPCPCVVCTVHSVIYKPIVPCPCVVCTVDSVIYKPIVPCPCVVCTVHSVIYKPIIPGLVPCPGPCPVPGPAQCEWAIIPGHWIRDWSKSLMGETNQHIQASSLYMGIGNSDFENENTSSWCLFTWENTNFILIMKRTYNIQFPVTDLRGCPQCSSLGFTVFSISCNFLKFWRKCRRPVLHGILDPPLISGVVDVHPG